MALSHWSAQERAAYLATSRKYGEISARKARDAVRHQTEKWVNAYLFRSERRADGEFRERFAAALAFFVHEYQRLGGHVAFAGGNPDGNRSTYQEPAAPPISAGSSVTPSTARSTTARSTTAIAGSVVAVVAVVVIVLWLVMRRG